MVGKDQVKRFTESAERVGATVAHYGTLEDAADFIARTAVGKTLVPQTALTDKFQLWSLLEAAGVEVHAGSFRDAGQLPGAGVTFCNFAMADTGTVVLDSTSEDIRLATTIPEVHFVLLDPTKILPDNLAAVDPMNRLYEGSEPRFVAYITGPSRTADIERVLTIGCHGPRQLHILLVPDVSDDLLEI
ncbi:LutC/YkgG family protein [Pelovirga terrestris]|uniref:Lactate utilization protein n=1 Tax=Pelovirga terrestris TaxID=2771352 RepID=A0A8J6UH00_9BACT|nr:lactate utilization protein [Pelovirga terrestris]MBD1400708.1 lactate utilization protein [Pelovirga terrestris]